MPGDRARFARALQLDFAAVAVDPTVLIDGAIELHVEGVAIVFGEHETVLRIWDERVDLRPVVGVVDEANAARTIMAADVDTFIGTSHAEAWVERPFAQRFATHFEVALDAHGRCLVATTRDHDSDDASPHAHGPRVPAQRMRAWHRGTNEGMRWMWVLASMVVVACGDDSAATSSEATGTDGVTSTGMSSSTGADSTSTSTSTSTGAHESSGSSSTGPQVLPERPEFVCPDPEQPACTTNDGPLRAGAAQRSIVPRCFEAWLDDDDDGSFDPGDVFLDCGCDRLCPGDEGYVAPDEGEGDEEFQHAFVAGFGSNRAATGVRDGTLGLVGEDDGLSARVLVLDQAQVRVAIIAVDTVGVFRPDVTRIRDRLSEAQADVDYVIVHAIHNHEGPDTMGLWGAGPTSSGYDPVYGEQWRASAVEATLEAIDHLEPVSEVRAGSVDASVDQPGGATNLLRDSRDPWIVDPTVSVLALHGEGPEPIATVIGYGCHPETLSSRNTLYTADFVHGLRRTVEQGSRWRRAPGRQGVGGMALFVNGAVGGMMTTLGVTVTNPDGDTFSAASFDKADSIGQILGEAALDALNEATALDDPRLGVMAQTFELPVHNTLYVFGFQAGVIERDYITKDQPPRIRTELGLLELGPLRMLTVPGELLPELAVGGYDGSALHSEVATLLDPDNTHPPDLDAAPQGPYLLERLRPDQGPRPWLLGLGNDELGYVIPEYDFVLADAPYLDEAQGDHYEETNSLGPQTAGLIEAQADALIEYANAAR